MHPLEIAGSIVGSIVAAIIILTLFFKTLSWVSKKFDPGPIGLALRGVLDRTTRVNIHQNSGLVFENVLMIGFTNSSGGKLPLPYDLGNLVVLEHSDRRRTMIPAKSIRMIEIPPAPINAEKTPE